MFNDTPTPKYIGYCVSPSVDGWNEGNVLFNDTINTFYLHLYGIRHMVKRKPSAATSWVILFNQQQEIFYIHHPAARIAYSTAFVTPVVEHWVE